MPNILTNSKTSPKEQINSFERNKYLSKDDLKTTFAFGLVAITASAALCGLLVSYYKQITK